MIKLIKVRAISSDSQEYPNAGLTRYTDVYLLSYRKFVVRITM